MKLNDLSPAPGSRREKHRPGRGIGSGLGKTGGRGHKGQGQLAGWAAPSVFEGARMPLIRRIPKRGFNNPWGTNFAIVNVGELEANFKAGDEVTLESLKAVGLCKRPCDALKVLGDGELKKKLKITAHKFSQTALDKIQKAGGEAVTIPGPKPVVRKKPRAKAKA